MRYLFFDIECADGSKAICEFGYVLCDENLNVIRKTNILMNPECEFKLTGRKGQKDLVLNYSEEEYRKHKHFDDMYDNIKFLMTQPDIMVFGHSVSNDIRYLIKDCNRYKLDKFDYTAYDIQKMLPVFSKKNKKYTSLETAFIDIVPEEIRRDIKPHKADDDAMVTMLVFKSMVTDLEFTIQDLLDSCPDSKISALGYWKEYKANEPKRKERRRAKAEGLKNKAKRVEGQAMWDVLCNKHLPLLDDINSVGKFVTTSGEMKQNHEELKHLIKIISEYGYVALNKVTGSDFVIVFDEKNKEQLVNGFKHPYSGKVITYKEFVNLLTKE